MVVFPLPVGEETPMRVTPLSSAERQSWMHSSWYGRRETAGAAESSVVPIDAEVEDVASASCLTGSRVAAEHDKRRIGGGLTRLLQFVAVTFLAPMVQMALAECSFGVLPAMRTAPQHTLCDNSRVVIIAPVPAAVPKLQKLACENSRGHPM